uniref:Uncharacterized protein n=1 Tax=Sphaerodactylus townsendi TaxID=933632 RepID=A0ACB8G2M2_9SAUR
MLEVGAPARGAGPGPDTEARSACLSPASRLVSSSQSRCQLSSSLAALSDDNAGNLCDVGSVRKGSRGGKGLLTLPSPSAI